MVHIAIYGLVIVLGILACWGYLRDLRDRAEMREIRRRQKARLMRQGPDKDTDKGASRSHRYREVRLVPPGEAFARPGRHKP